MTDFCNWPSRSWFAQGLDDPDYSQEEIRVKDVPLEVANVIGSQTPRGTHYPSLDLDFNVILLPSSTPGHFHLYLDKELSGEDYEELLKVLVKVGILQEGCLRRFELNGQTFLRPPWIKKVIQ